LIIPRNSSSSTSFRLEDGEQIALEVSNALLPPADLANKITEELKLIRYKYRIVSKINHQRKWVPGQLISTRITEQQIRALNQSTTYGPLEDVKTIDLLPFYIVTILSFNKPYNPIVLAEKLSFKYGFSSSPNTVYFDGNDIFYDESNSTYIFKRGLVQEGQEDCMGEDKIINRRTGGGGGAGAFLSTEGCAPTDKKHFWEFFVSSETGSVSLVNEYDIDVDGKKVEDLRYAGK
jgi:hypothetical protein